MLEWRRLRETAISRYARRRHRKNPSLGEKGRKKKKTAYRDLIGDRRDLLRRLEIADKKTVRAMGSLERSGGRRKATASRDELKGNRAPGEKERAQSTRPDEDREEEESNNSAGAKKGGLYGPRAKRRGTGR